ncbi:MAG: Uracil-DNA glycosylase superfamily [Firmicutes bacterium]|nr:Uracil-DNA glycosylase superfamily [Bacillota bacterium]
MDYRPKIACYVGIGVYRQFARSTSVSCGLQPSSVVEGIADFVVSSSSGLNRIPLAEQRSWFGELKSFMETMAVQKK